jgi:release factor glutamine methyltransferase
MTLSEALAEAIPRLRVAGIEDAPRDARLLLAHACGLRSDRLTLHLGEELPGRAAQMFAGSIAARMRRQPVSQLIGQRQFWGRTFRVTPDVLDPRPDTETLIAAALEVPFGTVLDLGTGSGCILLTLLMERPGAMGLGVDLSDAALAVAQVNCRDLGLESRAELLQGRWFAPVDRAFDLIVSNPPYIAAGEMPGLAPEVRDHEPHMALTDGGDGLGAYRAIAAGALAHLVPKGVVIVEIGPTQAGAVVEMMQAAGLQSLRVLQDMDGRDRVVSATKPG